MSVFDVASDYEFEVIEIATINSDTVTNLTAMDLAHYDNGFFVVGWLTSHNSGTFTYELEESDAASGNPWTLVPPEKLIAPDGTNNFVLTAVQVSGSLKRLGAFSTKRFVRVKITSAGGAVAVPATCLVKRPEEVPAPSPA